MASHGNCVRHDEAVVSLKGKYNSQECVETCNTRTLRPPMHLDCETLGLTGIHYPCGNLCLAIGGAYKK